MIVIEQDELTFEQIFEKVGIMGRYSYENIKPDNEYFNQPMQLIELSPWWNDWLHHGWDTGLELLLNGEPAVLRKITDKVSLFTYVE